jgi:hypothetical protein
VLLQLPFRAHELDELAMIYVSRGLDPDLAHKVRSRHLKVHAVEKSTVIPGKCPDMVWV